MGQFWHFSSLLLTPTSFQERCGEYMMDLMDHYLREVLIIYGGVLVHKFDKPTYMDNVLMISWWGLFQSISFTMCSHRGILNIYGIWSQSISFTKYRLRVIVNIWIKINDILVSLMTISFTQYSLYWIQHVAMLLVPFLLNAQVFLFVEESKSLFFFLWYLCN